MVTTRPNPLASDLDQVLAQIGDLWEELRGARLFITGGTGFFGCWLLETLLWANERLDLGCSVVVLTRNRRAFEGKAAHLATHPSVTLHDGDVRTFAFPDGPFTHVIHAATDSSSGPDRLDPRQLFESIVDGTRRTLECAGASGTRRFLLTSSGAIYGSQPRDLTHIGEDEPRGPNPSDVRAVYAEGKRAAEMLCAVFASTHLEPVIARCFAFVGPHLPLGTHFAAGNFIRDVLAGGPIRLLGDGTATRSYLYAADLTVWLWTILLRAPSLRPYNVGSPDGITIRQLAEMVACRAGAEMPIISSGRHALDEARLRYVPSVARATSELGLQITTALGDGIDRTLAWHRRPATA